MIRAVITFALLTLVQAAQRPQPAPATASIAGTVVEDDRSRTPLRRVTLTLVRSGFGDSQVTVTDDRGRYLFTGLPPGLYTLNATKGAYVPGSYGSTRIGLPGSPIPLGTGQVFTGDPIVLTRGAVLAGRLTSLALAAVQSVSVEAIQIQTVNGIRRRRFVSSGAAAVRTDARGMYRIYGLAPGDYVVVARSTLRPAGDSVRQSTAEEIKWAAAQVGGTATVAPKPASAPDPPLGRTYADAPTYFPGTADVTAAAVVTLQKAEERLGLDFGLLHVPTASITATVLGADGQPARGVGVLHFPKAEEAAFDSRFSAGVRQTDAEGRVFLQALPPGTYTLLARTQPPNLTMWGSVDVALNGEDRGDIQIYLQPAPTVSGRIVFEGSTAPPQGKRHLRRGRRR